ncbi:MAG TPA: thioredoxin [Leptolyngbyaceae cyanobacterium M33_DOE_097]|uniref:Thioredoxin n=1 Tax=Oscillatoriales cyanobacterium SpSt-418 TaxID=2282169 RepID=A0A7C3PCS5_9CYAN|nr:thioredoxin [Leptolyngbyaceae cyanobacterium M33_DOE_097]
MSRVTIIEDAQFQAEVLSADKPVLVYFWAAWCGPCRLMAPIIDGLADGYGDRLKVVKMEVDPNPDTVSKCRVEGVPAFRLFKAGEIIETSEGAVPKQKLEEMLAPHLG